MYRNLAELAHAALTAESVQDADAIPALPLRLDSATSATVADTCIRGDLGFTLLFHRRKDSLVAEELYFSTREGDGAWATAEHLSGGVMGVDPTNSRTVATLLNSRLLMLFGESETTLFTGRPQAEEGDELLRFYTLLVNPKAGHLGIEDTSPGADPVGDRTHKPLTSHVALFVLFPGERFTVRAMARAGAGSQLLGEPQELTGVDPSTLA